MKNPDASKTAQGSSMSASTPKVGSEAPSKTNDQQSAVRPENQGGDGFGVKSLAFKKVSSGY